MKTNEWRVHTGLIDVEDDPLVRSGVDFQQQVLWLLRFGEPRRRDPLKVVGVVDRDPPAVHLRVVGRIALSNQEAILYKKI